MAWATSLGAATADSAAVSPKAPGRSPSPWPPTQPSGLPRILVALIRFATGPSRSAVPQDAEMAYVNRQLIPKDRSLEQAAKRVLDVVIAGGLLIALAPVLAAIVLIVRLSSGSPVVYRWRVVGQHGR